MSTQTKRDSRSVNNGRFPSAIIITIRRDGRLELVGRGGNSRTGSVLSWEKIKIKVETYPIKVLSNRNEAIYENGRYL